MKSVIIYIKRFFVSVASIIFVSTSHTFAQTDTSKTNLQLNQVEVVKTFEVILQDARKTNIRAVLPKQNSFAPTYTYDITILPIELKYPDPQIKPLAMDSDPPFKVNNGYITAGYGMRKNPEFSAGYHTAKKDTYDAGFHLGYQALDNNKKVPFQQYRDLTIDLYGHYMLKENMQLYGNVETSFKKRYLFHTDIGVDTLFTQDKSGRSINRYGVKAGIKNAEPTRFNFNYDFNLTIDNVSLINTIVSENGINFAFSGEKLFKKNTYLGVTSFYDYTTLNGPKNLNLSVAGLQPVLKTKYKNLIFQGGVDLLYSSDGNSSVFPEIYISYGVAGPALQIFASVEQDYFTNHFRNVTLRNPFLANNPDSLVNTVFQKYFAGLKGQYSFVTYQISAGFKDAKQMMFLLNQKTDVRYFNMVYGDADIVFVSGNLDFALTQNISFGGWLTQNVFKVKGITNPWHTPNIEGYAFGKAKLLANKLDLNAGLYFGSKVIFQNKENVVQKSNALYDFNLSATYHFTPKFSLYMQGINLLDNKFERWYGYPSVGINGVVGVSVVF